jgi:NAD(P)-dependent dehydrogenase (short-subunit alcohol dehydrogenase family)
MTLSGHVALVTGAGRSVGFGIARHSRPPERPSP